MSDNALCYLNRHNIKIIENNTLMPSKDRILVFYVSDDNWDILTNGEFISKITKSLLFNVKYVFVEGDTYKHLKFLTNMFSFCVSFLPIVVSLDGCRTLFLEKTVQNLDGCCLNIKLPLKEKYSKEDRVFFKQCGEYRTTEKYKNNVLKSISLIGNLPLSFIRLNTFFMGEEYLSITQEFLKKYDLKIVIGNSI